MLVHGKIPSTRVNGPGDRAIVHFQSCSLGCPGCWNPETHNVNISARMPDEELVQWIITNAKEGVTFSGGEPMQQAFDLVWVIKRAKFFRPNLSFGMYTGYTEQELNAGNYQTILYTFKPGIEKFGGYVNVDSGYNPWKDIKENLDFAIMGRFNQLKIDNTTSLRSSTNQKLVLFTNRYNEEDFVQQQIEFTVNDGLVTITGFPTGMPNLLDSREW